MKTANNKTDLFPDLRSVRMLLIMAIALAVPFIILLLGSQTSFNPGAEGMVTSTPVYVRPSITPPPGCFLKPHVCTLLCARNNPDCCRNFPPQIVCPSSSPVPQVTCISRPSCLDMTPRCEIPEPVDGWCPPTVSPFPSVTPPAGCFYKPAYRKCPMTACRASGNCSCPQILVCPSVSAKPSEVISSTPPVHQSYPTESIFISLWKFLTGNR